jgi:hypothetical protein
MEGTVADDPELEPLDGSAFLRRPVSWIRRAIGIAAAGYAAVAIADLATADTSGTA